MKFLESDKNGNQHFTFEHSPSYQEVQHRFLKAVDSLNPEFIVVSVQDRFVISLITKRLQGWSVTTSCLMRHDCFFCLIITLDLHRF